MKLTGWQESEAKRLGLDRALDRAEDSEYQRKMRELREENMRRAGGAS